MMGCGPVYLSICRVSERKVGVCFVNERKMKGKRENTKNQKRIKE